MHLTLHRAQLAKALDFAARIAQRRTTIPIISNIMLEAEGGRLTIAATDLDIEAQTSVEADITSNGSLTVSAATLHEVVRKLAADKVTFASSEHDDRLAVKAGRAKFHLATLPSTDWPTLERGEMTHRFSLPAETVARALKKIAFAISNEETRYYLNGVYMHVFDGPEGPMLRMVTTDGHRLARIEMMAPEGAPGMPGVIIPSKTCAELARLADSVSKDKDSRPEIAIEVSEQKISFRCGESVLLSKLIDGTFPDYTRVIPARNEKVAGLARSEIAAAVERVATVVSERGRAIKLALDNGALTLSVANADIGDASEETEVTYDASPVEIGFNHKYLTDALGALDGEIARLELNDGSSPALLRSAADSDLLIVLMPMRV
jgi:DNA polymerase-3 subunit beta